METAVISGSFTVTQIARFLNHAKYPEVLLDGPFKKHLLDQSQQLNVSTADWSLFADLLRLKHLVPADKLAMLD